MNPTNEIPPSKPLRKTTPNDNAIRRGRQRWGWADRAAQRHHANDTADITPHRTTPAEAGVVLHKCHAPATAGVWFLGHWAIRCWVLVWRAVVCFGLALAAWALVISKETYLMTTHPQQRLQRGGNNSTPAIAGTQEVPTCWRYKHNIH
ncbi:hypothetical protein BS47DRAFT_1369750 [Hydnum rufescens UP504]|uniref:Uncharacterized protein n=1 Tax=Hydnum rufescens UP504 TaxID=1448309 RepID=A0A9P6DM39_9AGAM|nr:hypothetical protein BS47DRAFT_1369750 [Hydnum rufescens UP504]